MVLYLTLVVLGVVSMYTSSNQGMQVSLVHYSEFIPL